ncbi:Mitochondrial 2-oxoadipate and 2-oxoglutarate transporter [Penicillium cf. viridicatum]|uniref:Mitochondrial 2-oxoadipate and 2-oxoglutarate transporter n=1 Tax=Penicillium cf. viridicatum TaxID=2972119 RepID=A0A9W9ML34_9EURO|nr:Mitochondrial 2-oxoadipate and 2-oxoglutarate transporter [Penicillium cf. viridicatum]
MRSLEPSTEDLIQSGLQQFSKNPYDRENDMPFFVADFTKVIQQHQRWTKTLPRIQPFYAAKCNSDQKLLQLMADMNINLDCASFAEIE